MPVTHRPGGLPQPCDQLVKTILLGASNLWFADSITALAFPTESGKLAQLVEEKWTTLQQVPNEQFITLMRQMTPNSFGDFVGYSDTAIWQAIETRRTQQQSGVADDPSDLKQLEWEQLSQPQSHTPSKDFRLRALTAPRGVEPLLARVVLVERLREVRALLGFTRIDTPGELGAGPDAGQSRRMPLSRRPPAWVPAAEVRGEGIFVQFNEAQLAAWLTSDAAKQREHQFLESHMRWRQARKLTPLEGSFPGLRYVLLHSFAHAIMRQFVLECGYTAASLRERIYSRDPNTTPAQPGAMAGVLIYTAAPDSEGTLGGLVSSVLVSTIEREDLAH